jgi:hypothetical protein
MLRVLAILALFTPFAALAQSTAPAAMHGHSMDHSMGSVGDHDAGPAKPTQAGQGAFAAIQEIVEILEADPRTDWSKVDIDALRRHLIDMDNVTLSAAVTSDPVEGGIRFTVTGAGAVRDSIRRMLNAHAHAMDGAGGWRYAASDTEGGSTLTVRVPPQDLLKLKGLGFMGVMTHGMHHQEHHLMIARGEHPHG